MGQGIGCRDLGVPRVGYRGAVYLFVSAGHPGELGWKDAKWITLARVCCAGSRGSRMRRCNGIATATPNQPRLGVGNRDPTPHRSHMFHASRKLKSDPGIQCERPPHLLDQTLIPAQRWMRTLCPSHTRRRGVRLGHALSAIYVFDGYARRRGVLVRRLNVGPPEGWGSSRWER